MNVRGGCRDLMLCDRGSVEVFSALGTCTFVVFDRAMEDLVGDERLFGTLELDTGRDRVDGLDFASCSSS